jgi:hypothetical protein
MMTFWKGMTVFLFLKSLIFTLHSLHPSQEMVNGEGCEG